VEELLYELMAELEITQE